MDRDARSTVKFSKAKAKAKDDGEGKTKQRDIAFPPSAARTCLDRSPAPLILDVARRKTACQIFHRQVFERFRAGPSDLGAKRLVPARNLRHRFYHHATRSRTCEPVRQAQGLLAHRHPLHASTPSSRLSASQPIVACGSDQWFLSRDFLSHHHLVPTRVWCGRPKPEMTSRASGKWHRKLCSGSSGLVEDSGKTRLQISCA